MATGGFFALLDDLASIMDDLALMSKTAVKNAAGVAGDDLAVGAQQVAGVEPSRELPIVWAVAKGSLINKAVLVPAVLALGAVFPGAIMPLMMAGGLYLCYEGVEKVLERLHRVAPKERRARLPAAIRRAPAGPREIEERNISEAIKTDTVLSAEIVVIAHAALSKAPFATKAAALVLVALVMTAGIYGLIGLIVKADDIGLHLSRKRGRGAAGDAQRALGRALLDAMPHFMKGLSAVGTAAMFTVGGGILVHGIPGAAEEVRRLSAAAPSAFLRRAVSVGLTALAGGAAGLLALGVAEVVKRAAAAAGTDEGAASE